ncbi:uncharacterized protein TNCV_422491 [Trichonephila clavipes]|nr:uncharacterized protein TNCV_422491 [Trichonephila clavipes]
MEQALCGFCEVEKYRGENAFSFEHHAGDGTIWLHPNLEGENPGGGQGPPTSLPFPPTTREDLRLDGYLAGPYAAKALYIYKHPCLLQDSNPAPTAPQSASLTTIPWGGERGSRGLEGVAQQKVCLLLKCAAQVYSCERFLTDIYGIGTLTFRYCWVDELGSASWCQRQTDFSSKTSVD